MKDNAETFHVHNISRTHLPTFFLFLPLDGVAFCGVSVVCDSLQFEVFENSASGELTALSCSVVSANDALDSTRCGVRTEGEDGFGELMSP